MSSARRNWFRSMSGLTRSSAKSDPVWLANFRINERKVHDYRQGRVLLAGDAAHIHSPAGGQGMNTGMQDAFNLAWKLGLIQRGDGQAEPLLQSYSVERSAVGDQVLKNAERFTALGTHRNPVAQWLRNHIAPIVGSFQFVRDQIRDEWFELSIHYRHSPLSAEKWPALTGGLAAGDRLCDAPLVSATDGSPTTLFAAFRGIRPKLLLLPGSNDPAALSHLLKIADEAAHAFPNTFSARIVLKSNPLAAAAIPATAGVSVWIDTTGRAHEKLSATDRALFLIRPDGYIGYRGQPAERNNVFDYLDQFLIRRN